jgi:hypothetical protein
MKKSQKITEITPEEFAKLKRALQRKTGQLWGYSECVNGKTLYYMFPEYFEAFFVKDFGLWSGRFSRLLMISAEARKRSTNLCWEPKS